MKPNRILRFRGRILQSISLVPLIIIPAYGQGQYDHNGGNASIGTSLTFDGESVGDTHIPPPPYFEGTGQRDAFLVRGDGTLTLVAGADVSVINDAGHTAFARIGYGTDGTLIIQDGSSIQVGQPSRYANFHVGHDATGVVNQTGGTASYIGSVNIGANGGNGTYAISGGTLNFDQTTGGGTSLLSVGFNNAAASSGTSTGAFNINGGSVNIRSSYGGSTQFVIGNRVNIALGTTDPSGLGNGTVNQTAGVFSIGEGAGLFLSGHGDGVYNLSGGSLEIGGNSLRTRYGSGATGSYAFNFSGGSIVASGSDLVSDVDINVATGLGSVIDTNGLDATLSGTLTGSGTLVKVGAGNLNLSGNNQLSNEFYIVGGTVNQTSGDSTVRYLAVGSSAGANGGFNITDGSLNITNALQIGDFGGSSVSNINGGDVSVGEITNGASLNVGNQGGTGVLNLESGSLTLGYGLHGLGRMDNRPSQTAAGSGIIHINGGLLEIADGGSLILGDRIAVNSNTTSKDTFGSGVLNQAGGTVRVTSGTLFVAGHGATGSGTYNLDGGALEIGGGSLRARYNNSVSQSNFNLGGGELRVIGSRLETDVHFNLNTATTSRMDTADFGAQVSGFAGDGNLIKSGLSDLAITSASTMGDFTIEEGTVSTNSTVTMEDLHLNMNTTFSGSGFVQVNGTLTGTGALAVDTRISGSLAVGNSPGIIAVSNNLTVGGTGIFDFDLSGNSSGAAGITFDQITLTLGTFEMEDGAEFNIIFDDVDFSTEFWGSDQSWLVVDGDGSGNVILGDVSLSGSQNYSSYGSFDLGASGDNLSLSWTAVPEPSTALMLLLLTPLAAIRRRSR